MKSISFTVFGKPQPQGSSRAFMVKGRPIITSDNKNLKSFRQEVSRAALKARCDQHYSGVIFEKHVPVKLVAKFYFHRPPSITKKRVCHVVKPDASKLLRAAEDSLTGIIFNDDAQVVAVDIEKHYGAPERVELMVSQFYPA